MSERDLVLVGGGHAHALLIRKLAMKPLADVRVTLVSESRLTPYSGMLPGLVAGHYQPDDVHIDLNRLCRWAGVRFVQGRVSGLDPDRKQLDIEHQPPLSYDKVSFDTGSTPNLALPGARQFAFGVKPVSHFHEQWQRLLADAGAGAERHWGVIGAGAGGVELVLAMAHRLGPNHSVRFHLVYSGEQILSGYPKAVVRAAEQALDDYDIERHPRFRVSSVTRAGLLAVDGNALTLDKTILCTQASAPDWPAHSGLETANNGFIAVNRSLQSTSHPDVFATGDVAEMVFDPRPKAGVYAVRQAPFLYDNLQRAFAGEPLKPVDLQRNFLSLLSLGGQKAVGNKGRFVVHGDWVWRWKNRIDRAFMDKLQSPGEPMAMGDDRPNKMHCAGCGSKLGPALLQETLPQLPRADRPGLNPALSQAEDASLWQPTPGRLQVQSLDGFRAFSDDLYRLGQVSVHHALSDLYAMGADPVSAQVWVNLAFNHPRLQQRDFARLMAGVGRALHDQNVGLAGGHSTEGRETHLAIVANGELEPGKAWKKTGAQPGDVLVLTKPLGTGVILAADMAAQAPAEAMDAAWESMLTSNREAFEALKTIEPHAVTDVTGFGLIGHLLEMLVEGDLRATLNAAAVPALTGAMKLLERGWQSSLAPQLEPYRLNCDIEASVDDTMTRLMLDPQTSGGLLVALSEPDWSDFKRQQPDSIKIGHFQVGSASENPVHIID
ncbi:selenide, water dikinase SelD [Saccharospirillum salsuginis]|uniref:Selenide, water dikinase SelD n=1 Tax=Saccharospirillum salsuginis TaxID=418750 RepID=A0A918K412_9GAMM|nr:selenide, water dikinase SelD [Saccharospirillum salsuginis]GGX47459.1 hypothetical protein GCM10007392_12880 [Saccharospirillum salsuginis]